MGEQTSLNNERGGERGDIYLEKRGDVTEAGNGGERERDIKLLK